ncbi:DUF2461 domain-containing protein [Pontibacter cellulosilyticus]|uniref:DUF2461 domain-containing protein n=1 Tax=Pontibacter cellulosilyticus TaxID=1720253 RepID=A0A923SJB0_9BACT|nr:DUF2461 domain-containing protein [Pontibacter cellulosilyticus]MBC5993472.1 DUF2461 domain-containing protein [Pontibacter cellulosilyticus]
MDIRLILDFLRELQQNNSKEWMDRNREQYTKAKDEFYKVVAYLLEELRLFDKDLYRVTPKECIFRINKNDFSKKGEPPYKDHFAAGISPGGRHSPFANYVLVLSPGNSRAGGGMRQPQPKQLELIREEIDYCPGELESILNAPDFKESFGNLRGVQRKMAPKGYSKDHPAIDLIKCNGYQVLHYFTDEEACAPDFTERLLALYRQVKPLHDFLNRPLNEQT